jgi:hypothetical protein
MRHLMMAVRLDSPKNGEQLRRRDALDGLGPNPREYVRVESLATHECRRWLPVLACSEVLKRNGRKRAIFHVREFACLPNGTWTLPNGTWTHFLAELRARLITLAASIAQAHLRVGAERKQFFPYR